MAFQKVGYDGAWMFELAVAADAQAGAANGREGARALRSAAAHRRRNDGTGRTVGGSGPLDSGLSPMTSCTHTSTRSASTSAQTVTIKGWLHNRRSSGKIHFLVVRDGTGFLQVVMGKKRRRRSDVPDGRSPEPGKRHHRHRHGARGRARATGGYELIASGLEVVNEAHDYPITPKEHGVDYLMDRRHLWIRAERQTAILRVRHEIINAVRDFFNDQGFILADTPIFTPAACEGTTTLFPVQYFEDENGLPDAERPALQRSQRDGARQGLCVRPDVPRREEQDAPAPHRVLDGRARDGLRRPQRRHHARRGADHLGRRARARSAAEAS